MAQLVQILSFILFYQILVSSSLCLPDQSLVLWKFKETTSIDPDASLMCESSYPKTQSWNTSTDCCFWDGVMCGGFSGNVIGVDLSCSQIQGALDSNSTLFQLSHLQSLNLAYNDFASSLIPSNFSWLQSLTHLNLSASGFTGPIPADFSRLYNLISLDLSTNFGITVEPYIFEFLLQNSSRLREVLLLDANIGLRLPSNLSASLTVLNLGNTYLFGETPTEIFQLPNLQTLRLSQNFNLTGNLLQVEWNTSSGLSYLDLSSTNFSGKIPESIGSLKSLYHLDFTFCNFSESIPESLGNLTQLTYLSLFSNNLTGQMPSSLANLNRLITLVLSQNSLVGQMPNFFYNFDNLTYLSLSFNQFTGSFPSSIINLTKLDTLYLSNNLLTGPLPENISGFPNLVSLHLGYNSINGTIPSWILSLPALQLLNLEFNQLTGQLEDFQSQSVQQIFLDSNKLQGPIPQSISELVNLTILELSYNNFSGDVDVSLFSNLKQLSYLSLSSNNLSLTNQRGNSTMPRSISTLYLSSCGVRDLDFLAGASNLDYLDLSSNMLHQRVTTDQKLFTWSQNLHLLNLSFNFLTEMNQLPSPKLNFLDLRSNLLSGPLFVPPVRTKYFFASDNNFSGEIPSSLCNLSGLQLLDLSNNNLSGVIPQCVGNMNTDLLVLDLHGNKFRGIIPSNFSVGSKLRNLNLRNNSLEGAIPESLSNCLELEVVDIGNNHLNGTFPWRLTTLPKLQVLSLRSNQLKGPLTVSQTGLSFPALRILDISRNEFTGNLSEQFLTELNGMMKMVNGTLRMSMFKVIIGYYKNSLLITLKGREIDAVSVLSILTTIDLSSNKLEGVIPDVLGNLVAIQGLNLSHNQFEGPIPKSIGTLKSLEFLDISSNEMEGEIPRELTALTYLSVLNLSVNHLVGRIPSGTQLDTFQNISYLGNDGLCGPPMSKGCGANVTPPAAGSDSEGEDEHEGFISGFTWQAVMIGYGSGMVIGLSMGFFSFITAKPKWFNKIVEEEGKKWIRKKWPREVRWLSKSGK